jgi:transposase
VATDEVLRHQVIELRDIPVWVTEVQRRSWLCPPCGETTMATLPAGESGSCIGPRMEAYLGLLSGRYRMSRREVVSLLEETMGVSISVGTVQAACEAVSEALEPTVAALWSQIREETVLGGDETGWRENGARRWLWTAVGRTAAVFRIAASRGKKVAQEMLCGFTGRLITDRWCGYEWYPLKLRQLCWAHLKRDFQGIVDRGPSASLGERFLSLEHRLMEQWHQFRRGEQDRTALIQRTDPIRSEVRAGLEAAEESPDRKTRALGRELLAHFPALWTFLEVEDVEPTNNTSERVLRPAVLWRKGSFGTRSARGAEFVERMLSVAATARLRSRSLFDALSRATAARRRGEPVVVL